VTKRPTIHDVASLAGVSKSLVALVFKQDSGVSEARRERVLAAAAELGYTPNAWASALRSNNTGFVGIIVADLHNPIFTEIADEARQTLAAKGVFSFVATASILDTPNGRVLDPAPIQHLLDLKPGSLLIVGGLPDLQPFSSLQASIPIVVALTSATTLPGAVSIRSDDRAAMAEITAHLSGLGHSTVAYIGPSGRTVMDDRRRAFEEAAADSGLRFVWVSTGGDTDEAAGRQAATEALALTVKPTAMVCFNDNIAFGAQDAVARLQPPRQVAVTGYDNTYIAGFERISLTTVDQDRSHIVRQACNLLTDAAAFEAARGSALLVAPTLVVRGSSVKLTN